MRDALVGQARGAEGDVEDAVQVVVQNEHDLRAGLFVLVEQYVRAHHFKAGHILEDKAVRLRRGRVFGKGNAESAQQQCKAQQETKGTLHVDKSHSLQKKYESIIPRRKTFFNTDNALLSFTIPCFRKKDFVV